MCCADSLRLNNTRLCVCVSATWTTSPAAHSKLPRTTSHAQWRRRTENIYIYAYNTCISTLTRALMFPIVVVLYIFICAVVFTTSIYRAGHHRRARLNTEYYARVKPLPTTCVCVSLYARLKRVAKKKKKNAVLYIFVTGKTCIIGDAGGRKKNTNLMPVLCRFARTGRATFSFILSFFVYTCEASVSARCCARELLEYIVTVNQVSRLYKK